MRDLNKLTPTELLKMSNDIKAKHDALKQDILAMVDEMQGLEKKINTMVSELQELEKNYVEIVEILNE